MAEKIAFLSDVHLSPKEPAVVDRFVRFLDLSKGNLDAVYILGDLFDFWIGARHAALPDHQEALAKLKEVTQAGVAVNFLHGNRDFLVQPTLAAEIGVQVRGDYVSLSLNGQEVLLTHGDLLHVTDRTYSTYRDIIRSQFVGQLADRIPVWMALGVAKLLRAVSNRRVRKETEVELEAVADSAQRFLHEGVDVVICGHFHKASQRRLRGDDKEGTLFTLGGWETIGSYLEFDGSDFAFHEFS